MIINTLNLFRSKLSELFEWAVTPGALLLTVSIVGWVFCVGIWRSL
jgi:hypothetical protein